MEFIESPNKTVTNGRQIDLAVVHDMEAPEGPTTAENVARYFQNPAVRASAHKCHDTDSTVQCVKDKDVAWHAPGVNHNATGHELAGYARQTRDEWLDADSQAVMRQAASMDGIAGDCANYDIPVVFVDADGIRAGARGITTHLEVTRANISPGTHWDPGYEFPMDVFLGYVNDALGGKAPSAPSSSPVVDGNLIKEGDTGEEVAAWQRVLLGWGAPISDPPISEPDGQFGPTTTASTKRWQAEVLGYTGKDVDGIVGPHTRADTARVLAWIAAIATAGSPPAPAPESPSGLAVDGDFGPQTVAALQRRIGVSDDGIFGPETKKALQSELGVNADGQFGPISIRALQERVGAQVDGIWGVNTTMALQRALNTGSF